MNVKYGLYGGSASVADQHSDSHLDECNSRCHTIGQVHKLTYLKKKKGLPVNWRQNGNGGVADIVAALLPSAWVEDAQVMQRPSRRSRDPALTAMRAEWARVPEGIAEHPPQLALKTVKDDVTERASLLAYNGPPAITRATSKPAERLDKDGGGRDESERRDVEAAASSTIIA